MSEASEGDKFRRECVSLILQKCFGDNQDLTQQLAITLTDEAVITKGQRRDVIELSRKNQNQQALVSMIEMVSASDGGLCSIMKALNSDDLHTDKIVPGLVQSLLLTPDIDPSVTWLIRSWDDISTHQQKLAELVNETWPRHDDLSDQWPLTLIHSSINEKELQANMAEFVSRARDIISGNVLSDDREGDLREGDVASESSDGHVDVPQPDWFLMSGQESFDVINEEDCSQPGQSDPLMEHRVEPFEVCGTGSRQAWIAPLATDTAGKMEQESYDNVLDTQQSQLPESLDTSFGAGSVRDNVATISYISEASSATNDDVTDQLTKAEEQNEQEKAGNMQSPSEDQPGSCQLDPQGPQSAGVDVTGGNANLQPDADNAAKLLGSDLTATPSASTRHVASDLNYQQPPYEDRKGPETYLTRGTAAHGSRVSEVPETTATQETQNQPDLHQLDPQVPSSLNVEVTIGHQPGMHNTGNQSGFDPTPETGASPRHVESDPKYQRPQYDDEKGIQSPIGQGAAEYGSYVPEVAGAATTADIKSEANNSSDRSLKVEQVDLKDILKQIEREKQGVREGRENKEPGSSGERGATPIYQHPTMGGERMNRGMAAAADKIVQQPPYCTPGHGEPTKVSRAEDLSATDSSGKIMGNETDLTGVSFRLRSDTSETGTASKKSSPRSSASTEESDGDDPVSVFVKSIDNIRTHQRELLPLVNLAWPGESKLIRKKSWPDALNHLVGKEKDSTLVDALARAISYTLQKLQENPLAEHFMPPKHTRDVHIWLVNLGEHMKKDNDKALHLLVNLARPQIDVNEEGWHEILKKECSDDKFAKNFVAAASILLQLQETYMEAAAKDDDEEPSEDESDEGRQEGYPGGIEFKVIIATTLTPNEHVDIFINKKYYEMEQDEYRKNHYFLRLEKRFDEIEYRYCTRKGESRHHISEFLPEKQKYRQVKIVLGNKTLYDVASFPKRTAHKGDWKETASVHMVEHLPTFESVANSMLTLKEDVYGWVNQLKVGWKVNNKLYCIEAEALERQLMEWLLMISEDADKAKDTNTRVTCAMAIALSLFQLGHTFENSQLLLVLTQCLQVGNLEHRAQRELYNQLYDEFRSRKTRDEPLEDASKALAMVIKSEPSQVSAERILLLHLYWIVTKQSRPTKFPGHESDIEDLFYQRSSLPICISKKEWKELKLHMSGEAQKELRKAASQVEEMAKVNPYIVDNYQYFLRSTTLTNLMADKEGVCLLIPLDLILLKILPLLHHAKSKGMHPKKLDYAKNILDLKEFLHDCFKSERLHVKIISIHGGYQEMAERILQTLRAVMETLVRSDRSLKPYMLWTIEQTCETTNWEIMHRETGRPPTQTTIKLLSHALDLVKSWIPKCSKNWANTIVVCNRLLATRWENQAFKKVWCEEIQDTLRELFKRVWDGSNAEFLTLYFNKLADVKLCPELSVVMDEKACLCCQSFCQQPKVDDGSIMTKIRKFVALPFTDRSSKVVADTFQMEFQKFDQGEQSFEMNTLRFFANSPFALMFYDTFYINEDAMKLFSQELQDKTKRVAQIMQNLLQGLPKMDINVEHLQLLYKHRARMVEVLCFFESLESYQPSSHQSPRSSAEFAFGINLYMEEVMRYSTECESIQAFVNICCAVPNVEKIIIQCQELKQTYDKDIFKEKVCFLRTGFPSQDEMKEIFEIAKLKKSQIFLAMFKNVMEDGRRLIPLEKLVEGVWKISWRTALRKIWLKTKERLLAFTHGMDQGTIDPEEVYSHFKFSQGDLRKIHDELYLLYSFYQSTQTTDGDSNQAEDAEITMTIVQMKLDQIHNIFELQKCRAISEWIAKFRDKYKLKGDFEAIDRAKSFGGIDGELVKELSSLADIKCSHVNVLEAFTEQEPLIDWLQQKMEDEGKVKALCGVAMGSTKEVPMHMDKWSCLSDGVSGFSELIFHLETISGMQDLLYRCEKVWKKVDADSFLVKKWSDAGKSTDWYKENEHLYGSDEQTCLKYAQGVNERGVYTVGNLSGANNREQPDAQATVNEPHDFDEITVEGSVILTLKAMEKKQEAVAHLDYLHEVESKLMLIAGDEEDGEKDVNHFVHLLKAVESLAQAYVNLIEAGCMLFGDWTAVIGSSPGPSGGDADKAEYVLTMHISFKGDIPPLGETTTLEDINNLVAVFRETHERWIQYIDNKRFKHYFLNDYNIQQIKYLCSKLATMDQETMPDQAYVLLSSYPKVLVTSLIQDALKEAVRVKDTEEEEKNTTGETSGHEAPSNVTPEQENASIKVEKKKRMVRMLMQRDHVAENLAKAAVQAVGHEDIEDCTNWILLHEFDEGLLKVHSEEFDRQVGFVHQQSEIQVVTSILQNRSAMNLQTVIEMLQKAESQKQNIGLLASVKTICEGYLDNTSIFTLQNYLSVEHLGKFLTLFREAENSLPGYVSVQRSFEQHSFTEGRPNFIICRKQDIFPTILSLYAQSGRHQQQEGEKEESEHSPEPTTDNAKALARSESMSSDVPDEKISQHQSERAQLPSRSEVLICSEQTSIDEVQRFLRRAMCVHPGKGKLLFCMAFTEKLTFNVSKAVEDIFNILSQNKRHASGDYQSVIMSSDYHLVIISSDQQHFLSTLFDKYLKEAPEIPDEEIREWLSLHFTKLAEESHSEQSETQKAMVKVVTSERSGVGKSLHIKRTRERLPDEHHVITVRLLEKYVNNDHVVKRLYKGDVCNDDRHFVHIDISPAVQEGIDKLIFDFLILGGIQDNVGKLWRRQDRHFYAVELTETRSGELLKGLIAMLPRVRCFAPVEALKKLSEGHTASDEILIDDCECLSETYQRPYQYLKRHKNNEDLDDFWYSQPGEDIPECITILLDSCGMKNPSWAQLKYFASFLNLQLDSCEKSEFCRMAHLNLGLGGLKEFAVKFMIRMSQDFATPSLHISDTSQKDIDEPDENEDEMPQIRRKWEEDDHPYVFFNEDRESMSFINVNISAEGHLLDKGGNIVVRQIASKELVNGLRSQGFSLRRDFHLLSRNEKLKRLRSVMGIDADTEPDSSYEITTENALKMLAIHMRFRSQLPVIVMGETGCGKTRMIEFMSKLKSGVGENEQVPGEERLPEEIPQGIPAEEGVPEKEVVLQGEEVLKEEAVPDDEQILKEDVPEESDVQKQKKKPHNMVTIKVHGGVTVFDIYKRVQEARRLSEENMQGYECGTTLFFDEANTTTAIHAIKEVMCDGTIDGESFEEAKLQIVAACNPYKKLSPEALSQLESGGLGYRVKTSDTSERLGNIPMRTLVYRVVALPPSIQPFVWDFGELGDEAEAIYIEQMTIRMQEELQGCITDKEMKVINKILSGAQKYMRSQHTECRYVSLRDVERTITIMKWFYKRHAELFPRVYDELRRANMGSHAPAHISNVITCLVHALGISYHVSLQNRKGFRNKLSRLLQTMDIGMSPGRIDREYTACQEIFLQDLKIDDNIAVNEALRENVFLMAICSDLKLPLFLIGKPGSSKSLAKTVVETNMKGQSSTSDLYKMCKEIQIFSYQCSALTRASGIEKAFELASRRQEHKSNVLDRFASVVVLDEIGLAEDSEHMPLKILHPLLECGSTSGMLTDCDPVKKVGFVGISNWALDPAKMNRGVFVSRNVPSEEDLIKTAKAIFQGNAGKGNELHGTLSNLTKTYLKIYEQQHDQYFGLRDYYSLIKMIRAKCGSVKTQEERTKLICDTMLRNFSGGSPSHQHIVDEAVRTNLHLPPDWSSGITVKTMVSDNLQSSDSRFLMLLTNKHSSVSLLHHVIPQFNEAQVIFGSSFPGDHTYTEICKNINRIKVCMEKGQTVVLLNLTEIHESLYDVLNQHYTSFGEQTYVTLGLGGHRLWCRISNSFRIIVIEKKEIVHRQYPIPLINRLEKHDLLCKSLLNKKQLPLCEKLTEWVEKFSKTNHFSAWDAFSGYHDDTISSVVLAHTEEENMDKCKRVLMQSVTADAVFRLPHTKFRQDSSEVEKLLEMYNERQHHDSLFNLLQSILNSPQRDDKLTMLEVISFSNILTEEDRTGLEANLELADNSVMLISLQQFKVEQEYKEKLDSFFKRCMQKPQNDRQTANSAILLIQVSQAHKHGQLIECAKYSLRNTMKSWCEDQLEVNQIIIAFLQATERRVWTNEPNQQLVLQHTKDSTLIYVDELRNLHDGKNMGLISFFYKKTFGEIVATASQTALETSQPDCSRDEGGIVSVLRDCVCESMTKVKSSDSTRHLKRIKILRDLCSEAEMGKKQANLGFQKVLFEKFAVLYNQGDKEIAQNWRYWIAQEAMSPERLQEGGTFGKTLHLRLKRDLADLLACVVSVVDENDNLDIIAQPDPEYEWKTELWLQLFDAKEIQWKGKSDHWEYEIQSSRHLAQDAACRFPFSFAINEMFQTLHATCTTNAVFTQTAKTYKPELQIVSRAFQNSSRPDLMMIEYAHDVIKFLFSVRTDTAAEHEYLVKILSNMAIQTWKRDREIDGIAITFLTYREIFEQLKMISSIFKVCPDLPGADSCTLDTPDADFRLHEHALSHLLKWANVEALAIDTEESCSEWMVTSNVIKHIYHDYIDQIKCEEIKQEIQKNWKPISLLDLLLMHLLPGHNSKNDFANYVGVIVSQAKRLLKGVKSTGFHGKSILKIITNVLRRCHINVRLNLLLSWGSPDCRRCANRIQVPVKLPCGDYLCKNCAENIASARVRKQCPTCLAELPPDFRSIEAELSEAEKNELNEFKANCTSFFLEYLDQFCFSTTGECLEQASSCTQNEERVKRILYDLVINSHKATQHDPEQLETEALDLSMATMSNILQILIKHNEEIVRREVNASLAELADPFRSSLITTTIKGREDALIKDMSGNALYEDSEHILRNSWEEFSKKHGQPLDYDTLKTVAGIRFALVNAIGYIQLDRGKSLNKDSIQHNLLHTTIEVCEKRNDIMVFVMKAGFQSFGREWLNFVGKHPKLKALVPNNAMNLLGDEDVDYWTLFGEKYTKAKASLNDPTNIHQSISEWLSKEGDKSLSEILPEIMAVMKKDAGEGERMPEEIVAHSALFPVIWEKSQEISTMISGTKESQAIHQLVLAFACTLMCKPYMTQEFEQLATDPVSVQRRYWPAMPDFNFMFANKLMRNEVPYRCINGHPYYVGECALPMEEAKCVDCGAMIGGRNHIPVPGNRQLSRREQTLQGYQLATEQKGMENPADRITQHGAAVIQFFVHSCMLIGMCTHPTDIARMINKSRMRKKKQVEFLVLKLEQNLEQLAHSLGHSIDDAIVILYEILKRMQSEGAKEMSCKQDIAWTTRDGRRKWELEFRRHYLLPVFRNIDNLLMSAQTYIMSGEETKYSELNRLMREVGLLARAREMGEVDQPVYPGEQPQIIWRVLRQSKTNHLLHCIADSAKPGEVLQIILQTPNLHLVQHLKDVLDFQALMIDKFKQKYDMNDVEKFTIAKAMQSFCIDYEKSQLMKRYIKVWNEVYPLLEKKLQNERRTSRDQLQEYMHEISEESKISMALPSSRGRGKCAKELAEFLIEIQNEFLEACKQVLTSGTEGISEMEVSKLSPSHFVSIDKQRDLLPLIHLHTTYEIMEDEHGCHHHISYNIDALEKQAREKFVIYKKLIRKRSLPCIKYPQDIGIGSDWNEVLKYTRQEPLPQKIVQEIDETVQKVTPADVSEGVRTLTHAISFLAKIGGMPSRKLCDYLGEDLKQSSSNMAMIPRTARICHTLALYSRLTWYKSVNFVRQGLEPYKEALYGVEQERITDPKILRRLKEGFEHMDVISLQQHLNEMLIKVPDYRAWWSLQTIFPSLDSIEDVRSDSWYNRIPEEICFKHVADLFKLSVEGVDCVYV